MIEDRLEACEKELAALKAEIRSETKLELEDWEPFKPKAGEVPFANIEWHARVMPPFGGDVTNG